MDPRTSTFINPPLNDIKKLGRGIVNGLHNKKDTGSSRFFLMMTYMPVKSHQHRWAWGWGTIA